MANPQICRITVVKPELLPGVAKLPIVLSSCRHFAKKLVGRSFVNYNSSGIFYNSIY